MQDSAGNQLKEDSRAGSIDLTPFKSALHLANEIKLASPKKDIELSNMAKSKSEKIKSPDNSRNANN